MEMGHPVGDDTLYAEISIGLSRRSTSSEEVSSVVVMMWILRVAQRADAREEGRRFSHTQPFTFALNRFEHLFAFAKMHDDDPAYFSQV
jgi:hypothetical protein